jgi:hypothetical protein
LSTDRKKGGHRYVYVMQFKDDKIYT